MRGIDISNHQNGLDISRLADGDYNFVILKATEGSHFVDAHADDFYCKAAFLCDIPCGAYCYSHATTPEQAREEALFLLKTIRGVPMPLGLYMDVEAPEQLALPNAQLKATIDAFCDTIREAGYTPGIYGSEYNTWRKVDPNSFGDAVIWVAHYGKQPDIPCDLWQDSDSGRFPGYNGPVDTDVVRSERFIRMVTGQSGQPPDAAKLNEQPYFPPDLSVLTIQAVMVGNGYNTPMDGQKSPEFFAKLREFVDDMEAC